jgi:hypothetical protein
VKPKILAIVVAALLLAGGGAFALTRFLSPAEDDALALVPADAYFYTNVFIEPSNSQKQALDDFLQKFPGIESSEDVIEKLTKALEESLSDEGLDYEGDIKPWLGNQLGAFGIPGGTPEMPNGALFVESKDDEAAREFLDKAIQGGLEDTETKTHNGVEYEADDEDGAIAFVGGFMVAGTEDAIKEAIDTLEAGETLETAEKFTKATGPLRDDWIGQYYLDTAALFEEFQVAEALSPEDQAALETFAGDEQQPQAGVLYVTGDSAVFESSGAIAPGPFASIVRGIAEPGLVPELPAASWAAFGIPELGDLVGGMLEAVAGFPGLDPVQLEAMFYAETGLRLEQDVLSWMGDAGLFVQGANFQEIGGGLVIESTDPAKTTALVGKLRGLLRQFGIQPEPLSQGGLTGFSVQIPGTPAPINVLGGDRLAITYGPDATAGVTGEGETLADSEAFGAAQESIGEDFNISFFVDVDAAQAFGEALATLGGAVDETYNDEAKPVLDVFTHVVIGAKKDGDSIVSKLVVGVE